MEKLTMRNAALLMHVYVAAKRGKSAYVPKHCEECSVPALMQDHLIEYVGPAKSGKRSAYRITLRGKLAAQEYMRELRRCAPPERPSWGWKAERWEKRRTWRS